MREEGRVSAQQKIKGGKKKIDVKETKDSSVNQSEDQPKRKDKHMGLSSRAREGMEKKKVEQLLKTTLGREKKKMRNVVSPW